MYLRKSRNDKSCCVKEQVLPPGLDKALPERAHRSGVSSESLRLLAQLLPSVHTRFDICEKKINSS